MPPPAALEAEDVLPANDLEDAIRHAWAAAITDANAGRPAVDAIAAIRRLSPAATRSEGFASNGARLVAGGELVAVPAERQLVLMRTETATPVAMSFIRDIGVVEDIPNHRMLLVRLRSGSAIICEIPTLRRIDEFPNASTAVAEDGAAVVAFTQPRTVSVWDPATKMPRWKREIDSGSYLRDAVFADRGRIVMVRDASLSVIAALDPNNGRLLIEQPPESNAPAFSPNGHFIAHVGMGPPPGKPILVVLTVREKLTRSATSQVCAAPPALAFNRMGDRLAVGCGSDVFVLEVPSLKVTWRTKSAAGTKGGGRASIAFVADDTAVFFGRSDGSADLVEAATGNSRWRGSGRLVVMDGKQFIVTTVNAAGLQIGRNGSTTSYPFTVDEGVRINFEDLGIRRRTLDRDVARALEGRLCVLDGWLLPDPTCDIP